MTRIDWRIAKAQRKMRRRREFQKAKSLALKGIIGVALIGVSLILTGAYSEPQRLVETTYAVQKDDTLWAISEAYMAKNTGSDRYILDFMEGIKELNPELLKTKGEIYPGQKLRINYWVKDRE